MKTKKTPARRTAATPVMADDRKWKAEDALHTLTRAEEHRRDPRLMADVSKLAAEKKQILSRVARTSPRKKG